MGFLLEEQTVNAELVDTVVKRAITEVADVISRTASENVDDFEKAIETLDGRLLISLRDFFRTLDDSGAVIRIVEDERAAMIDTTAVHRAREREAPRDSGEEQTAANSLHALGSYRTSGKCSARRGALTAACCSPELG